MRRKPPIQYGIEEPRNRRERRAQMAQARAAEENQIDVLNEKLTDDILADNATHTRVAHPTKGIRKTSIKRLEMSAGHMGKLMTIHKVIETAQKPYVEEQQKEEENGQEIGNA